MNLDLFSIIGFVAAACTTVAFVPQVIHIFRFHETKNISLFMYIIFTTGVFLWLVYGLFRGDAPIVIANSITFVLAATILTLKIKNG